MNWADAVRLGRVSNLPTVWTNALAGMILGGGLLSLPAAALLLAAVSLAYVGGMFLNDAFDAEIDAAGRPERPIPSGRVSRRTVFTFGLAMLGASVLGLAAAGLLAGRGLWPAAAGIALAGLIVFYNWHHKGNPISPVVMGLCRVMVYVAAALCVATVLPSAFWIGAGLLLCHLIGLTYLAKQETLGQVQNWWPLAFLAAPLVYGLSLVVREPATGLFWICLAVAVGVTVRLVARRAPGDIPRGVMTLIAGISILDAMLIAAQGRTGLALAALIGFPLTLAMQRYVRGT
jgi:4-hydroxybenzoate polyprenyltransferase